MATVGAVSGIDMTKEAVNLTGLTDVAKRFGGLFKTPIHQAADLGRKAFEFAGQKSNWGTANYRKALEASKAVGGPGRDPTASNAYIKHLLNFADKRNNAALGTASLHGAAGAAGGATVSFFKKLIESYKASKEPGLLELVDSGLKGMRNPSINPNVPTV